MEVEVNGKTYHAAEVEATAARCYVCEETCLKHRMVDVGPVKDRPELHIYRCEDCYAGSPKWVANFMARSSVRQYFRKEELNCLNAEEQREVGKRIVAERCRQVEAEIMKRRDEKGGKVATVSRSPLASGKKAGARSAVIIQKTRRRDSSRNARVTRTRSRSL